MTFILKKLLAAFSTRQRSASQGLHGIFALLVSAVLMAVASTASAAPDVITYIHTDVSGSPLAATDDTGAVVWKESYRAYGERWLHQSGSEQQTQWFHGKEQDAATGLQYFGVRHYDPVVGRFMGIDPVDVQEGNLHSFNRYAYGNNNPVKFKDPDGGYAEAAFEALSLAIGIDSFRQNFGAGNYAAAAVDGMGVAADAVLAAIPVAPGIAGLGIKAVRESSGIAAKGSAPIWSATKSKSAVENAFGHWQKHAAEFPELANAKQYAETARSLVTNPPAGALTRARGAETLIYDQATNTFLVRGANGAPKTMFRPTDGIDYWNKQ